MKSAIASEVKQEILERVKKGEKVPELGKQYGVSDTYHLLLVTHESHWNSEPSGI